MICSAAGSLAAVLLAAAVAVGVAVFFLIKIVLVEKKNLKKILEKKWYKGLYEKGTGFNEILTCADYMFLTKKKSHIFKKII
jgi:hypothetical protein